MHFLLEPLQEGAEVEIEVDWKRRFDHMQQHSGTANISPSMGGLEMIEIPLPQLST